MDRKQWKGVIGIVAVLAGILVVPPVLQHFYGIDAVQTAFIVIIIYAVIGYHLKQKPK